MRVPLVLNRRTGTAPVLVHAPGTDRESPWWLPIRRRVFEEPGRHEVPPGLALLTYNSGHPNEILSRRGHGLGWFERSLEQAGLPYVVLGQGLRSEWRNRLKLELTLDFLRRTAAQMVLGADSSDVLLVGDPARLVARLSTTPDRVLFNAEKRPWPREAREVFRFERTVARGPFRYLNSGLWLGRREPLIAAFECAARWAGRLTAKPDSDQICWKYAYRELYPAIEVDTTCSVFQCLNDVGPELEVAGVRWPRLSWLTGRLPQ
ncbi:MAG: hypothetical protein FJ206_09100 [Gemmatimonadetes bacterium]|nr:hypothetical protein [Gemmatimonadota bacterium]